MSCDHTTPLCKPASRMMDSVLVAALVLAFGPTVLRAVVTGSISGTARDASGAVVPGVTVKARNTWTGVVQTLQTDSWQRDSPERIHG